MFIRPPDASDVSYAANVPTVCLDSPDTMVLRSVCPSDRADAIDMTDLQGRSKASGLFNIVTHASNGSSMLRAFQAFRSFQYDSYSV